MATVFRLIFLVWRRANFSVSLRSLLPVYKALKSIFKAIFHFILRCRFTGSGLVANLVDLYSVRSTRTRCFPGSSCFFFESWLKVQTSGTKVVPKLSRLRVWFSNLMIMFWLYRWFFSHNDPLSQTWSSMLVFWNWLNRRIRYKNEWRLLQQKLVYAPKTVTFGLSDPTVPSYKGNKRTEKGQPKKHPEI